MDKSKAMNDILSSSSIEDMYAVAEWSIAASDRHDDDEEKFYSVLLYIIAKNFCKTNGIKDTYQMPLIPFVILYAVRAGATVEAVESFLCGVRHDELMRK